jgi:hypothetical protein
MSYIKTGHEENKISAESLNKWDDEMSWEIGQLNGTWKVFGRLGILGAGQRRGVHVNVPKIGSRAGLFCFGGI